MRSFVAWDREFRVTGNEHDAYYAALPDHDLSGLGYYFSKLVETRDVKVCLDVGANIGLAALLMTKCAPNARIYSFEPSHNTFSYLAKNIQDNGVENSVAIYENAIGDTDARVSFSDNPLSSGGNHILLDDSPNQVSQITIDGFCANAGLKNIDFIKIDVEGFEHNVIAGARNTIYDNRPFIMLEYNELAITQCAKMDPVAWISNILKTVGSLGVIDPSSGRIDLLPPDASTIVSYLKSISKTKDSIFDLVNWRVN